MINPASPSCIPLNTAHVAAAYALSSSAGWNQTIDDWRLLLELADTCCGTEADGQLIATATLICYGQRLGWIGMVLTHPDFRRRGFARTLVSHVIQRAADLGIRTLKLDATDFGRDLYTSLGFRAEQTVERWTLRVAQASSFLLPACGRGASRVTIPLDAEACGYGRQPLLERLAAHGCTAIDGGYVLDRPGRLNRYLGPCVARTPAVAQTLV